MREKIYLNDFSIRLQHNKMLKIVKGFEYFLNAQYAYIYMYSYRTVRYGKN